MKYVDSVEKRVGQTLCNRYRLEALLGVGGMAAVYRATHIRNGNAVAVKVLHDDGINSEIRARFLREGYLANRVEHEGTVRVLDDDVAEDGAAFLVMELLTGETLKTRWLKAGRRLPLADVAVVAHRLLDILAAAHDREVVHRDVKPENVFITSDGSVKLLDFGIARALDTHAADGVTRSGMALGSPPYMAPEQALGLRHEIDGQTDIWAIGATMFKVLSGEHVHEGQTSAATLVFAGSRRARSLASVAPDVLPAFARIVDRALAFDKCDRWPSARAMQAALAGTFFAAFGALPPRALAVATPGGAPPEAVPARATAPAPRPSSASTAIVRSRSSASDPSIDDAPAPSVSEFAVTAPFEAGIRSRLGARAPVVGVVGAIVMSVLVGAWSNVSASRPVASASAPPEPLVAVPAVGLDAGPMAVPSVASPGPLLSVPRALEPASPRVGPPAPRGATQPTRPVPSTVVERRGALLVASKPSGSAEPPRGLVQAPKDPRSTCVVWVDARGIKHYGEACE